MVDKYSLRDALVDGNLGKLILVDNRGYYDSALIFTPRKIGSKFSFRNLRVGDFRDFDLKEGWDIKTQGDILVVSLMKEVERIRKYKHPKNGTRNYLADIAVIGENDIRSYLQTSRDFGREKIKDVFEYLR